MKAVNCNGTGGGGLLNGSRALFLSPCRRERERERERERDVLDVCVVGAHSPSSETGDI